MGLLVGLLLCPAVAQDQVTMVHQEHSLLHLQVDHKHLRRHPTGRMNPLGTLGALAVQLHPLRHQIGCHHSLQEIQVVLTLLLWEIPHLCLEGLQVSTIHLHPLLLAEMHQRYLLAESHLLHRHL